MNLDTLITEKSIKFPTEQEVIQKIQVIESSLQIKKISFLDSTKSDIQTSAFHNKSVNQEALRAKSKFFE